MNSYQKKSISWFQLWKRIGKQPIVPWVSCAALLVQNAKRCNDINLEDFTGR